MIQAPKVIREARFFFDMDFWLVRSKEGGKRFRLKVGAVGAEEKLLCVGIICDSV